MRVTKKVSEQGRLRALPAADCLPEVRWRCGMESDAEITFLWSRSKVESI